MMKKVTVVGWLWSCALGLPCCHGLLSSAAETDQRTTSGSVNVLLPEGPQDNPSTAKPVNPLYPDRELLPSTQAPVESNNQLENSFVCSQKIGIGGDYQSLTQAPADSIVLLEDIQTAAEKGTKNWLGITYAPKNFQFKVTQTNSKLTTVYAEPLHVMDTNKNQEVDWPNYLQITDERGRGSGWTLNVKQETKFTSSLTKKSKVLAGAELALGTPQGTAELLSSGGNDSYKPDTVKKKVALTPNESVDLIVAHENQGLGTWIYRFGNEQTMNMGLSLTFPTAAYTVGGYTSTLTWAILDAPVS